MNWSSWDRSAYLLSAQESISCYTKEEGNGMSSMSIRERGHDEVHQAQTVPEKTIMSELRK